MKHIYFTIPIVLLSLLFLSCIAGLGNVSLLIFKPPPVDTGSLLNKIQVTTPLDTQKITDFIVSGNIEITFEGDVTTAVEGKKIIITPQVGTPQEISVTDNSQVTFNGKIVTIDLNNNLAFGTLYIVKLEAEAFENGRKTTTEVTFSIMTEEEPTTTEVIQSLPDNQSTSVPIDINIVLTFNVNVIGVANKNITLTPTPNTGDVITIPVNDSQVTIVGRTVTINPNLLLDFNQMYTVIVETGAFVNSANIATTISTTFTFTTQSPPTTTTVEQTSPMTGATDVAVDTDMIITFNTPITAVVGKNISITPSIGNIPVNDSRVTIDDSIVTINLTDDLNPSTLYTVTLEVGAFVNSDNIPTTIPTNFSFTTVAQTVLLDKEIIVTSTYIDSGRFVIVNPSQIRFDNINVSSGIDGIASFIRSPNNVPTEADYWDSDNRRIIGQRITDMRFVRMPGTYTFDLNDIGISDILATDYTHVVILCEAAGGLLMGYVQIQDF